MSGLGAALIAINFTACSPSAVAGVNETCAMTPGSLAQSPDGAYRAGLATCIRSGKLEPKKLHIQDTRSGALQSIPLGAPSPSMAGFWGDGTLAVLWVRETGGANRVALWVHDLAHRDGQLRGALEVPANLRLLNATSGRDCALARVTAVGQPNEADGKWFIANPSGLIEVVVQTAYPTIAYWLGGSDRFVIGQREPGGLIRPVATVDCRGAVGDAVGDDIPAGAFDVIKSAAASDLIVLGHNDNMPALEPSSRANAAGGRIVELHGVMSQDFAVSDDGEWFAVVRGGNAIVYRSSDLRVIATVPAVDSDSHVLITKHPPAIIFADDQAEIHRKTFEAAL
ncbi:MAG: hypothetical protein JWR84_621 [Caulobacter sp.]|nr:hypothetical protein [Caulobacter sp.]